MRVRRVALFKNNATVKRAGLVAQVENGSRDIMESPQPFSTWLRLEVWLQSGRQNISSTMEESLVTSISSMEVMGCSTWR